MGTNLESLNQDELLHLIGLYNDYVQEFDYENSGTPVSVYEYFEYEYQELLEQNKN